MLDRAIEILRLKGHQIGNGTGRGGFVSPTGDVLITVDGRSLTHAQVYELAGLQE